MSLNRKIGPFVLAASTSLGLPSDASYMHRDDNWLRYKLNPCARYEDALNRTNLVIKTIKDDIIAGGLEDFEVELYPAYLDSLESIREDIQKNLKDCLEE